jgi:hypothetical protein
VTTPRARLTAFHVTSGLAAAALVAAGGPAAASRAAGPNGFVATGTVANMRPCSANAPGTVPCSAFRGHHAVFRDNVQSYSAVESAIDLTVFSALAFAWLQAGGQGGF